MKKEETYSEGFFERAMEFVEKDRVGLFGAVIILVVLAYLRSVGECALFNYPSTSLYIRAVHEAIYFALFMTGAFLVTLVSGVSGRKVFNVILFGWWIILIPPIVDYFLGYGIAGGNGVWGYPYPHNPNPLIWMADFFSPEYIKSIGIGEMLQLWLVILLPGIYVGMKKRSLFRASISSLSIFLFIVYIVTAMNFIKDVKSINGAVYVILFNTFQIPVKGDYYLHLTLSQSIFLIQQQVYLLIVLYYVLMFLGSSVLFMYIYRKDRTVYFLRSVRWKRLFAVIAAVLFGFFVPRFMLFLGMISYCPIYPEYILHIPYVGIALISSVFAAQVWNMMEDLNSDDEWDAPYTKKQYLNLAVIFAVFSLSLAYLLGYGPFIMALIFIFVGYLYASKIFEVMKTPLAPFVLSMYAVIPFAMAYYTPTYWLIKIWGPTYNQVDPSMFAEIHVPVEHPLYPAVLLGALTIYMISFVVVLLMARKK